MSTIKPLKCGIKSDPPTLVLTYVDEKLGKKRQRSMPLRNFSTRSGVSRAADDLRTNPRHRKYLKDVPTIQIERLLRIVQERQRGLNLDDSIEKVTKESEVDPNEDLNALSDTQLNEKKEIMNESFEQNRKKQDDPDFVYDVEVDFQRDGPPIESSGWDSDGGSDVDF